MDTWEYRYRMSESSTEVTNASAFKKGSLGKQAALAIVTLGLYGIYWWYDTNQQFADGTGAELNPVVQTVLFVIPPLNLYAIWKYSGAAEKVAGQSAVVLFLLFIVFPPAGWYLVQTGINGVASE